MPTSCDPCVTAAEDRRASVESLASVALTLQAIAVVLLAIGTVALYELYSLSNDLCAPSSSCTGVSILSVLTLPLVSLALGGVLTAFSVIYIRTPLRTGRLSVSKMPSLYAGVCGIVVGLVGLTAFYTGAVFVVASMLYLLVWTRIPSAAVTSLGDGVATPSDQPSADYLRGRREGVGFIEVPCLVCGQPIQIDTRSGRAKEIVLESFRRFRHGECPVLASSTTRYDNPPRRTA